MKLLVSFCVLYLTVCQAAAAVQRTVRYDDEILVRCPANVPNMKEFLQSDDVDIWTITADGMADLRVHKDLLETNEKAKSYCTLVANVETLVQQFENTTLIDKHKLGQDEWFEQYHDYDEAIPWYREQCSTGKCRFIESIGQSLDGRDMPAIHFGEAERKIYFQCLIHAREWISGAVCMYIVNYLVENFENERVQSILEDVQFVIVPFVNPDGYAYSWSTDRLWRKNRRVNSGSNCRGVDLNRNYNDHWNEGGSSGNPCSETYHGTGPASEPETQNTQNYFKANAPIIGAIDWHSYSQLLLRPYGWTNEDAPDEEQMKAVNDEMSDIIYSVHGVRYTSQKSIGLYPTTGSADDWFYGEDATGDNKGYRSPGITVELRDTGSFGFLLPPEQIIPTGEEIVPAALYFAEEYAKNPVYPSSTHRHSNN